MQNEQQRETMLNRAWNGAEGTYQTVTDQASHLQESAGKYVQHAPITSSLVSFGVGVGIGLFLSQLMLPQRRQSRWYDNYVGYDRAQSMEDLAHRYLPNSLSRRLGV